MELEPTPYAEFPTSTRFRRPDYKYFKTVEDQQEFLETMENHPDKLPTPPIIIRVPKHSSPKRPKSAFSTSSFNNLRQMIDSTLPSKSKVPEDWKPVYPHVDLTSEPMSVRYSSRATTANLSVYEENGHPIDSEVVNLEVESRPEAPQPPKSTENMFQRAVVHDSSSSIQRPRSAHPSLSMSVAEAVDFNEFHKQQSTPTARSRPSTTQSLINRRQVTEVKLQQPTITKLNMTLDNNLTVEEKSKQPVIPSRSQQKRPQTAPPKVTNNWKTITYPRQLGIQGTKIDKPQFESVNAMSAAYDKALKKHGWRMEIPGDPYKLKKQFIPERKSICVKVPEPEVLSLPPKMQRENRFTFFHTTMPRVTFSFDIHPSFTSENYAKTRDKLKKQGKWNYSYRDFAFIY